MNQKEYRQLHREERLQLHRLSAASERWAQGRYVDTASLDFGAARRSPLRRESLSDAVA
jgi:hypothetical protein